MAGVVEFRPFPRLPLELRALIWKEALREEVKTRRVIVDPTCFRVLPRRDLVSTFLSVSRESRREAKAFYNTKVDVYRLPPQPMGEHDSAKAFQGTKLGMETHIEELGHHEGCIHVSPRFDLFFIDTYGEFWQIDTSADCGTYPEMLCTSRWMPLLASSPLTKTTGSLVENAARITWCEGVLAICDEVVVREYWKTDFFAGIRHYFHVPLDWEIEPGKYGDFQEGAGEDFELFARYDYDFMEVLKYEKEIPCTFRECMWVVENNGNKVLMDEEVYTQGYYLQLEEEED